jgi:tartrate/fumarate subfamily iron-sulfur-dependent hydro-lyase beta chain
MTEYHLSTPLSNEDISQLRAGDTIYLSGTVFTARDEAHMELIEHKGIPGFDMTGLGLYHCGPVMKQEDPEVPEAGGLPSDAGHDNWCVVSAGPTTSFRMETLEPPFLDLFGVKVIIGKGGMGPLTLEALRKHTVVYVSFTGGAGALAAKGLGRVKDVHYLEELGMPEAVWVFEAKEFGPLVVSMDSHGHSLYSDVNAGTMKNLTRILTEKGLD